MRIALLTNDHVFPKDESVVVFLAQPADIVRERRIPRIQKLLEAVLGVPCPAGVKDLGHEMIASYVPGDDDLTFWLLPINARAGSGPELIGYCDDFFARPYNGSPESLYLDLIQPALAKAISAEVARYDGEIQEAAETIVSTGASRNRLKCVLEGLG